MKTLLSPVVPQRLRLALHTPPCALNSHRAKSWRKIQDSGGKLLGHNCRLGGGGRKDENFARIWKLSSEQPENQQARGCSPPVQERHFSQASRQLAPALSQHLPAPQLAHEAAAMDR